MERSRSIDGKVGGDKMKGKWRNRGGASITIIAVAIFLTNFTVARQAWSAEITPEVRETITREVSDQRVRGRILDNLSRATKSGLSTDAIELYVNRAVDGGVSPSTLEHLTGVLAKSVEDGLPSGPVVVKVLEGIAKSVPEDRLVLAVDRVLERLEFAAEIARIAHSKDEERGEFIVRTADAVTAGMDRKRLRSLAEHMGDRKDSNASVSLQVMEMVKTATGYGVPQEKVERVARNLIDDEDSDSADVQRTLRSLVQHDGGGDGDDDDDVYGDIEDDEADDDSEESEDGDDSPEDPDDDEEATGDEPDSGDDDEEPDSSDDDEEAEHD